MHRNNYYAYNYKAVYNLMQHIANKHNIFKCRIINSKHHYMHTDRFFLANSLTSLLPTIFNQSLQAKQGSQERIA